MYTGAIINGNFFGEFRGKFREKVNFSFQPLSISNLARSPRDTIKTNQQGLSPIIMMVGESPFLLAI